MRPLRWKIPAPGRAAPRWILPVAAVVAVLLLFVWIVAMDPGLTQIETVLGSTSPRPSLLTGMEVVQMRGSERTLEIRAATGAFDLDQGTASYRDVDGVVYDAPEYGRIAFSADRAVSSLQEREGGGVFADLIMRQVTLLDNTVVHGEGLDIIPASMTVDLETLDVRMYNARSVVNTGAIRPQARED